MKKGFLVFLMLVCGVGFTFASNVVSIIELGIDGAYFTGLDPDNGTGSLTWSSTGGTAIAYVDDTALPTIFTSDVTMNFTNGFDTSGSLASAKFLAGTWSVDIKLGALTIATFSGVLSSPYFEEATDVSGESLVGGAVATIGVSTIFDNSYFDGFASIGTPDIGIKGFTSFDPGQGISDYQSDWTADNIIVELVADEGAIPEPMTLGLLGLGAVLLRKRA